MHSIEREIADQITSHITDLLEAGRTVTVCNQVQTHPLRAATVHANGGIEITVGSSRLKPQEPNHQTPMLTKARGILLCAALRARVREFCCSGVNDESLTFRIQ